jgi:hypothetical protein
MSASVLQVRVCGAVVCSGVGAYDGLRGARAGLREGA